nr:NfeD family protein [uncultured Holophaga sp.]
MPALWWLFLLVIFLVIEMVTPGLFFFACMAGGALLAAVAGWLGLGHLGTWIVFLLGSALLVLTVAPLARRWMKRMPHSPVGLDALAGQRARVIEAIDPDTGRGQVRLGNGALWRATADAFIPQDSWVEIRLVVGTRLQVCQSAPNPEGKE